jgi:predicted N-acetyltransferase YhbS
MPLVRAAGPILQEILDASHPLWGEGLTRQAYEQYNVAQVKTAWGSRHLDRVALVENGRVLSTAKRYELEAVLDGRAVRVLGIGAVFTPTACRGQGHAGRIIEQIVERAAADGFGLALLFSEIGPDYYRRFGFTVVPREVLTIDVRRQPGAPAVPMRAGELRDVSDIAEIEALHGHRYRFALRRDPQWIEYGLTKKRVMSGLLPRGARDVQFFVVEEGSRAVAWIVTTRTAGGWTLEECGDRDPSGSRAGALFQALLAGEPSAPMPLIRGWLPPGWLPPQLSIQSGAAAREIMMVRPLVPEVLRRPLAADDVHYWHGDAF